MARRVLFLTQTFPREANDTAGPFIAELARGLVRAGDEVMVLVPHARGVRSSWSDRGVEVRSFRYAPESLEVIGYGRSLRADERIKGLAGIATPLYLVAARRAVARELARRRYDWIHAHWIVPNGLATKAPASSRRRPPSEGAVKLAFGLHGSDVFLAEKPSLRRWVARALRGASLVTGCSPELVDRIRALDRRAPRPAGSKDVEVGAGIHWQVIPYGVDSTVFSPGGSGRTEWRRELGLADHHVLILGVGRMATKKGFQVLVPALGPLLDGHPEARLVLAGGGDLAGELASLAAPWGERVQILGSVSRDRLPGLYRAAEIFVLPAVHDAKGNVDGLPNVILEAMASGLPVVASAISGIPLAIDSDREGLLVPEGDAPTLIQALERLIDSDAERRRMGAAGRSKVETELTWDHVAGRYLEAYRQAETSTLG